MFQPVETLLADYNLTIISKFRTLYLRQISILTLTGTESNNFELLTENMLVDAYIQDKLQELFHQYKYVRS